MAKYKIIWSEEALSSLDLIIDFIFEEWGIKPILVLQDEIDVY